MEQQSQVSENSVGTTKLSKEEQFVQQSQRLLQRLESARTSFQEQQLQGLRQELSEQLDFLHKTKDIPKKLVAEYSQKFEAFVPVLVNQLIQVHIFELGREGEHVHVTNMADSDISADKTTTYGKLDQKAWSRFERQFTAGTHEYDIVQMLIKLGKEALDMFGDDENGNQKDLRKNFTTSKQEFSVIGEKYYMAFREVYDNLLYKEPVPVQKTSRKSKKVLAIQEIVPDVAEEVVASEPVNESDSDSDESQHTSSHIKRPRTQEEKDQLKREKKLEKERERKLKKDKKKGKTSSALSVAGGAVSTSAPAPTISNPRSRLSTDVDPITLKKLGKMEQAKLQIAISSAETLFRDIFEAKGPDDSTFNKLAVGEKGACPNVILKHKYLEARGLALLFFGKTLFTQRAKYTAEKHLKEALGMISAMIAFCEVCRGTNRMISMRNQDGNIEDGNGAIIDLHDRQLETDPATGDLVVKVGKIVHVVEKFVDGRIDGKYIEDPSKNAKISITLLNDVMKWVDVLKGIYPYDGETIQRVAPHLLIIPDFAESIPSSGLMPREFQFNAMKKTVRMMRTGGCLAVTPTIGVGKTTLVLADAVLLQEAIARNILPADEKILYVCDTDSVRTQVGTLCYNAQMPFAVMTTDNTTGRPLIRNHFNCGKPNSKKPTPDEKRVIMITDTATACLFLSQMDPFEREKYHLKIDEPTIGADILGSACIRANVKLLLVCPSRTTLISATLPKFEEIPLIVENIRSRHIDQHEEFHFETVSSNELQIGISLYTHDKKYWAPYLGCTTQEDVRNIITKLETDPFLMRTCTSDVLLTLAGEMKRAGIVETPNIASIFSSPKMLNPKNVMKVCLDTLKVLALQPDYIITKVCSAEVLTRWNTDRARTEDQDDIFEQAPVATMTEPIISHFLGTKQAYLFNGPVLVSAGNPFDFARKNFGRLYHDVISEIRSIKDIMSRYTNAISSHKKVIDRISDRDETSEREKSMKIQETEEIKPQFAFPEFGVIGTHQHFAKYTGRTGQNNNVRAPFGVLLENNDFRQKETKKEKRMEHSAFLIPVNEMATPDWIITLLFCGIGFYAEQSDELCPVYRKTISRLASEGLLALVIADGTISYGTNWPFTNVYIDQTFVCGQASLADGTIVEITRSLYFLFQNLGRAGRFGKSWRATGYIPALVAELLTSYSKGMPLSVDESANMEKTLQTLITEAETKALTDYENASKKREEDLQRLLNINVGEGLTVHRASYSTSNPVRDARRVAVEEFAESESVEESDDEADEPVQAQPVQPVQAQPVQPVQAQPVQPVQAQPVQPPVSRAYKAPGYRNDAVREDRRDDRNEERSGGSWSRIRSTVDTEREHPPRDQSSSASSGRWERANPTEVQQSSKFGGTSSARGGGRTNSFQNSSQSLSRDRQTSDKKPTVAEGMWRRNDDGKR